MAQSELHMNGKLQTAIRNLLLAFVLVSIGFVLGKHSVRRGAEPAGLGVEPTESSTDAVAPMVRVYYLHATFRCATCNTIERMAHDVLDQQFGTALADGRIQWREADFQENVALAKQFDVITSCVVVAKMRGDTVLDFKRLDEVWTLLNDPRKFNFCVSDAVRHFLE